MKLLFRNLNRRTNETSLKKLCMPFGVVTEVTLVVDPTTLKSKGFGFVEMASDIDGKKVIAALHESMVDGNKIRVKDATPQED